MSNPIILKSATISDRVWREALTDLKHAKRRVRLLRKARARHKNERWKYPSICEVCVSLAMHHRSEEVMTEKEETARVEWLRWRLNNWQRNDTRGVNNDFDEAVANLINKTLEFYNIES